MANETPTWRKVVFAMYILTSVGLFCAWGGLYVGEKLSKGFYTISFGDQYTASVLATALGIYAMRMVSFVFNYYMYYSSKDIKCRLKFKCTFYHIMALTIVPFYNPKAVQVLIGLLDGKPDNLMAALFFSA
ncbi:hypothetical protein LPJ53_005184, partial [Coemansia erecta]